MTWKVQGLCVATIFTCSYTHNEIYYFVLIDFTPSVFYLDVTLTKTVSATPSREGIWDADGERDTENQTDCVGFGISED